MAIIRKMTRLQAALVFIACYGGTVALARTLAVELSPLGLAILALAVLVCVAAGVRGGFLVSSGEGERGRSRAIVLSLVILASFGFWAGSAAAVGLLGALVEPSVELWVVGVGGGLALVGAGLGAWLSRRGFEPSPITRMAVGLVALALACVFVAGHVELGAQGLVSAAIVSLGVAAAFVGPASVAAIARFAGLAARGPWLAAAILSLLLGRGLGVLLADHAVSAAQVFECCLGLGFAALAVAVLSSPSWRPLRELEPRSPVCLGIPEFHA